MIGRTRWNRQISSSVGIRPVFSSGCGVISVVRTAYLVPAGSSTAFRKRRTPRIGLPIRIPPGLDREEVLERIQLDKKKRAGQLRFVLPVKIGEVRYGMPVELDLDLLREVTK